MSKMGQASQEEISAKRSATNVDPTPSFLPESRLTWARGEGVWVWDDTGKRYLDLTSGIGVMALGHGDAALAEVVAKQCKQLVHCSNLFANAPANALADALVGQTFADKVWFANSGAEANEAAIKFARLWGRARDPRGQKNVILAFEGGFHGRTLGALSTTYTPSYREPFEPLMPGVRFARFNDLASVEAAMDHTVCGILVEPIQGEGGVHVAAPGFLAELAALGHRHGAALILDEVQCGMGRTGKLLAHEYDEVAPDMVCLAKPLAGGLPLGAVLFSHAVDAALKPGHHGSTFSGGPVACAAGVHVLNRIAQPDFLASVAKKGEELCTLLDEVIALGPVFSHRRGRGLMQALVVSDPQRYGPADLVQKAQERGLLVTRAGSDAVRLLPPLVCSKSEFKTAADILAQVALAATA